MAMASLPGNQFFERITLMVTNPGQRSPTARDLGHEYWPSVPFRWYLGRHVPVPRVS